MKGYSPGPVGAVKVFCSLPSTWVSNFPLGSEVTECSTVSLLTMLICAPGDTVIGSPKLIPEMVMVAPLAAGAALLVAVAVLLGLALGVLALLHPVTTAPIRRKPPSIRPIFDIASPFRWLPSLHTFSGADWFALVRNSHWWVATSH